MEIKTILRHGNISVEVVGSGRKEISTGIHEAVNAIKDNLDLIKEINEALGVPAPVSEINEKNFVTGIKGLDIKDEFINFLKVNEINPLKLNEVFEFDEDKPILVTGIAGKNRIETQINASLSLLLAYKRQYGRNVTTSGELIKALDASGIDTDLIWNATTKMKDERYIVKSKGSKTNRFTSAGEKQAIVILKNLIGE